MFGIMLAAILAAYASGLWLYHVPFTGDQKVYLSTALEMSRRGEWLHPYLFGETSYFKPPLQYWATILGWKAFGFNLVGTYAPSVLAVVATAAAVHSVARRHSRDPSAALWFAGSAGTLTFGLSAQMEIWLVCLYATAWALALRWERGGSQAWIHAALAAAGALSLVKSPLYSTLWVSGLWLYLALGGRRRLLLSPQLWVAQASGAVLGASWFAYAYLTDRDRFWSHYVLTETLSKRGGNGSTIPHLWLDFGTFFFPFVPMAAVGLAALALPRLMAGESAARRERLRLLAGTSLLPAVFFSAFPYRTETYLYLILPFLVLCLDWVHEDSRLFRLAARVNGVILAALGAYLAWALRRSGMIQASGALLLAGAAAALAALSWSGSHRRIAWGSLLLIFALRVGATQLGESDLAGLRGALREHPGKSLAFYDPGRNIWHEAGLLSAATRQAGTRALTPEAACAALRSGSLLVVDDGQWPEAIPALETRLGPEGPRLTQVAWTRWKRAFSVPRPGDLTPSDPARSRREYRLLYLR